MISSNYAFFSFNLFFFSHSLSFFCVSMLTASCASFWQLKHVYLQSLNLVNLKSVYWISYVGFPIRGSTISAYLTSSLPITILKTIYAFFLLEALVLATFLKSWSLGRSSSFFLFWVIMPSQGGREKEEDPIVDVVTNVDTKLACATIVTNWWSLNLDHELFKLWWSGIQQGHGWNFHIGDSYWT